MDMPHAVKISEQHQLGAVRLTGVVDSTTLLRSMDALYHGETWVPMFNTIWDCRSVTVMAVDPSEIQQILQRMKALNLRMGPGRSAVVAPCEIVSAFVRMIFVRNKCAFRERRLFQNLDAALQWITEMYPTHVHKKYTDLSIAPL